MLDTKIERSQPGGSMEIRDPAMVGEKVVVGEKSKIGPYAVIGEHTILGKEVHIQNSVIFPGVLISDFTSIDGAIIGEDTSIGRRVKIEDGCMIGDQAVIQDNVTLTRDVTVCPFRKVSKSVLVPGCLM
jgi:NDP-sugar pyrophosphorylase family protein